MNEFNENNQFPSQEPKRESKKEKSKVKGFFSLITAGIVGSVLTLTVAPYTDYFKDLYSSAEQTVSKEAEQATVGSSTSNAASSIIKPTQTSANGSTASIADIVENASKAIVGIVNLQNQNNRFSGSSENVETGSGSGVIFKKTDGAAFIVTNNHVIEGAAKIEVSLSDGEKTTAELIGADALTDLAVLKIDPKYATDVLEFGDSSTLRAGDQVLAIGNPLGLDLSRTVTQGIVSAVDRTISVTTSAGDWELNVIQTDAAINPGNSGGALINAQGKVVGINSLKISENGVEGLGFAIPSKELLPIVNEIIKNGQVVRPYIGVSLTSLEEVPSTYLQSLPENIEGGAMVAYIDPNSAASKAGLQVQDVIVSINDTVINNSIDLRKYLYSKAQIGDTVTLKVYSQGKQKTIKLTLTSSKTN